MKKNKRDLILEATEKLLLSVTADEISVDAIAKKAGIGKGSVYYYFKSKDEIFSAVVEKSYRRAVREYFSSIKNLSGLTAFEKFKRLFHCIVKKEFDENSKNLLIALHMSDDPALQSKMNYTAIQEVAPVISEILEQGIAEGSMKTDTPKESAEIIVAVLTVFLDNSFLQDNIESLKIKLKIFSEVLETCLKTEPGSFRFLYNKN